MYFSLHESTPLILWFNIFLIFILRTDQERLATILRVYIHSYHCIMLSLIFSLYFYFCFIRSPKFYHLLLLSFLCLCLEVVNDRNDGSNHVATQVMKHEVNHNASSEPSNFELVYWVDVRSFKSLNGDKEYEVDYFVEQFSSVYFFVYIRFDVQNRGSL